MMQRTTPSPHPTPAKEQSQSQPLREPHNTPHHHDRSDDQNQGQVQSSFPPPHSDHPQKGGQEQEQELEQECNDAPPPSSQLVKYGSNLPPQVALAPRVISLPPLNSLPLPSSQFSPNLYNRGQEQEQGQGQGRGQGGYQQQIGQRYELPPPPPRSPHHPHNNQQHPQFQGQAPTRSPSLPSHTHAQTQSHTQTPKKNPFANPPPPSTSMTVTSSPVQTPNRPSDPSTRLLTDPVSVSANRLRQTTVTEGTTYAPSLSADKRGLVKRGSKGVNGGFTVPWKAPPGQEKEKEKEKEKDDHTGQGDSGGGEKISKTVTNREPSAEKQHVSQAPNAQTEAAQSMDQAVQDSSNHKVDAQGNHVPQIDSQQINARPRPSKVSSRIPVSRPSQDRFEHQQQQRQQSQQQQRATQQSQSGEQVNVSLNKNQRSPQPTQNQSSNSAGPPKSAIRSVPNQQQGNRQSPNQQPASTQQQNGKERQPNRPPPNTTQPASRQSPAQAENDRQVRPQQNQEQGRSKDRDQGQDRGQFTNDVVHPPIPRDRAQQGSSPSPCHSNKRTEYLGQQRNKSNQCPEYPADHEMDDYEQPGSQVVTHDYAYKVNTHAQSRSQGKRARDQNRDQEEDVFRASNGQKRRRNEMVPTSSETEVERGGEGQGEAEEENPFDAFAEIEKYDYVKDLQEPWNDMMEEMVPFIDGWAEKYLSTTLDTIYSMYGCFYNMSKQNAESLEAGVGDILEYQNTQNEIRQTLVDFRRGVADISDRLMIKPPGTGSRGNTPQGGGK